jgi:hypothetical protein
MLYRMSRYRIWLTWMLAASAVFTLMPTGYLGLAGWLAGIFPLMLAVAPSFRRERILIAGLIAIVVVAFAPEGQLHLYSLVLPMPIFLISMWLAPPSLAEPTGKRSAANPGDEHNTRVCLERLNKELGRARRFNRNVTVLSLSAQDSDNELLERMQSVLAGQLHNYCEVFNFTNRLVAIIPELGPDNVDALVGRVLQAMGQQELGSPSIGHAAFPADAITSQALIELADRRRSIQPVADSNASAKPHTAVSAAQEAGSKSPS